MNRPKNSASSSRRAPSSVPSELTEVETQLLTLLDRERSMTELSASSGLSPNKLSMVIKELRERGLVRLNERGMLLRAGSSEGHEYVEKMGSESTRESSVRLRGDGDRSVSDSVSINPDLLEPTIDIDLTTQKKILRFNSRLVQEDHYGLLGVPRDADKGAIKSSYFALMNEFHTDKFFGKNIGGFTKHLNEIVDALTKANDTLGRKKTRAEYDKYLASRESTLGVRDSMVPPASEPPQTPSPLAGSGDANSIPIPRAPRAPRIGGDYSPPAGAPPKSPSTSPNRTPQGAPSARGVGGPTTPPVSRDAARRMLARKMGRRPGPSSGPAVRVPTTPRAPSSPDTTPASRQEVRKAVDADLKARYDARMGYNPAKAKELLASASEAEENGDWPSAVNSIRMAISVSPGDTDIRQLLERTQIKADQALAPKFAEQGKYEEKDGRYERAARSYERSARGSNSADLYNRSAACLMKAKTGLVEDKRKAVELSRNAVTLDNKNAVYRLTLARAYDAAGMKTSALGEARRALELEPDNDEAKQLQKDLK